MESIPNQNHIAENRPPTEEEMEKMRKQNFLQYLKENPAKSAEQKDNVVKIETVNAEYNIVYSNHRITNSPEDVYGSDVILLEFMHIDLKTAEKDIVETIEFSRDLNQQYSEIIKYAAEHSISIYPVDTHKDMQGLDGDIQTLLLPLLEGYASYRLIKSSVSDSIKQPLTRRSFLKNLGKVAAAAYLSTPAIEALSSISHKGEPNESSTARNMERKIRPVNELIHPELDSMKVQGRNTLMAIKSEYISKVIGNKLGRKPKISLIIGSAHTGIEDTLKMTDEQRMTELKKYLNEKEIENEKSIFCIEWDKEKPVVSKSQI